MIVHLPRSTPLVGLMWSLCGLWSEPENQRAELTRFAADKSGVASLCKRCRACARGAGPMSYEVRHGRWQDVLCDVDRCDAMIVDAPYSAKVHAGQATELRDGIDYGCMTPEQVGEHVAHWSPITEGWFITITCHILAPIWSAALERAGRYTFAPLPYIDNTMGARLMGDGPCSWTCWIVVARPRDGAWLKRWKDREHSSPPGFYLASGKRPAGQRGGKPIKVMRAIMDDYTWPGDLVIDTHAGSGTTLAAAAAEGRYGLGAEVSEEAWARAQPFAPPPGLTLALPLG